MTDINTVTLVGRLTRDIEVRATNGGTTVGNMSIAFNRQVKKGEQWEDEAGFIDAVMFGNIVNALEGYLVKGKQIAVKGALRMERWQDKDSGANRSKISLILDGHGGIQLLGSKNDNDGGGSGGGYQAPRQPAPAAASSGGFESDIPF